MTSNDVQTGSPDPYGSWRIQKRILVLRKCFQLSLAIYSVLFQRGNLTYLLCGDGGLCQALEQVRIRNCTHFCLLSVLAYLTQVLSVSHQQKRSLKGQWDEVLYLVSLPASMVCSFEVKELKFCHYIYPLVMNVYSIPTPLLTRRLMYQLVWLQRGTNLAAYPTPWELYCIMF